MDRLHPRQMAAREDVRGKRSRSAAAARSHEPAPRNRPGLTGPSAVNWLRHVVIFELLQHLQRLRCRAAGRTRDRWSRAGAAAQQERAATARSAAAAAAARSAGTLTSMRPVARSASRAASASGGVSSSRPASYSASTKAISSAPQALRVGARSQRPRGTCAVSARCSALSSADLPHGAADPVDVARRAGTIVRQHPSEQVAVRHRSPRSGQRSRSPDAGAAGRIAPSSSRAGPSQSPRKARYVGSGGRGRP